MRLFNNIVVFSGNSLNIKSTLKCSLFFPLFTAGKMKNKTKVTCGANHEGQGANLDLAPVLSHFVKSCASGDPLTLGEKM